MLDKILVLDMDTYGSISIARKLRSQHIYCKILPGDSAASEVAAQDASGIVWAGQESDLRPLDEGILNLDTPMLAVGAAALQLADMLGAQSDGSILTDTTAPVEYDAQLLFEGISSGERWFSRAERLTLSPNLMSIAKANGVDVGFCDKNRSLYGLQFSFERNDPDGVEMLANFCVQICGCTKWWSTEAFVERATSELARLAGNGLLICALSGGVDSSVCAMLCKRAVGSRMRPVFIDTGLMRQGEDRRIESFCRQQLNSDLTREDARELFLDRLKCISDPCGKEQAVNGAFWEALTRSVGCEAESATLVLGTNYSEVLDGDGSSDIDREYAPFRAVVEPLIELFKDEVRAVGELLGLPQSIIQMQSFPATGLAGRILGEVDAGRLNILRAADVIFQEEIEAAGQERRLRQYYAMLTDSRDTTLVLRALSGGEKATAARLPFDLLGRVVERVGADLPGVKHVYYELTAE
ncbi:MAG: hypothetical protein LBS72_03610 [Oscillospiraceae bacterium]|jgi:GMP synthase (glutamine-hydrolysing)|nr:hypothetical protein [Oscillospiraceae bacterium]